MRTIFPSQKPRQRTPSTLRRDPQRIFSLKHLRLLASSVPTLDEPRSACATLQHELRSSPSHQVRDPSYGRGRNFRTGHPSLARPIRLWKLAAPASANVHDGTLSDLAFPSAQSACSASDGCRHRVAQLLPAAAGAGRRRRRAGGRIGIGHRGNDAPVCASASASTCRWCAACRPIWPISRTAASASRRATACR